jgi:hypothetical protein
MTDYLFAHDKLSEYLAHRRAAMLEEIERYDRNKLLNSNQEALRDYFVEKFGCDIPELHEGELRADESEARIDVSRNFDRMISDRSRPFYVPGTRITLILPFSGEAELLGYTPSTRFMGAVPSARVEGNTIIMDYTASEPDEMALSRWKNETLSMLRQYAGWLKADLEAFNRELRSAAGQSIERRRQRLLRSQGLAASLGVPLVTRADAPRTVPVSDIRKRTVGPPPASAAPFTPEPALAEEQFEQILSLLRPMGATIERDPAAFASLDEESLRSLFLATLNSHYQGRATGETFNASGKTDILIRENDRNIFIAECKFWRGQKSLAAALDQLLSYATWRDGKLALLLFVKQKSFADVLSQIPELIRAYPNYVRGLQQKSDSEWRCTVELPTDKAREATLSVLVFHLRINDPGQPAR